MPPLTSKGSDWKLSNIRIVCRPVILRAIQSVYSLGMRRCLMLCTSLDTTVCGKAPEISKKRLDTTRPFLHLLKAQCTASISESLVDLPGLAPNKLVGRRSFASVRWVMISDTQDESGLAMVFRRVIGRCALGIE